jgi:TP901 family phage tail tape measure protein
MADENIVTNIVANADFSNLIADVHKVTASLSKLQEQIANSNKMLANQISVMNKSFSDTLRSTGQFSTHFVSLQSDVEKFGKNLDGGKLKLNQYFQTLQTHARTSGGLIRDLAKQQVSLQNAILQPLGKNAQGLMQFNVHVPRGLDEIKNKSAIARQELQIMNKVIQEGAGQLINWGKNTQWAGRQLTVGLTVPLAAFGKAAADAFRQADQELVRLTKVYGDVAGTSAQELGKVRDDVIATSKELSKAYGVSFKDTIALAADIAATGKQGNDLLASVKETSRLAVLGEVDRQDAMKATLAIQTAFKQNTEELSESINFLNAVENQTSTTLNDLVEAIPKAGPVIQGLGGSVKDLALYLTAMKEGGINASEGANALKSALASLINPTNVAVEKFQGFGIDLLGIVSKNAGDVTGTLLELQGALDNLDPLKKQQAIEQLFGKFQFARLNALFENLGKQGSQTLQVMDLMKASSQDLANVAGRELSAVTESASGKYRRAVEGLKADLAGVGEQFLSINTALINIVDKVLQFVNNLPKPLKQALSFLGGLTAVAGPLIMLTGVLANFFGYILKGVGHMKAFFRGGEGWKYLTPEILASEKAGKLMEQTFYSDAKAAGVLQLALRNLIDEFTILEGKAKSGAISVAPAINTMAGNLVQAAGPGGRVVNPQHPLISKEDTRSMSHMNPVAGMTEQQKLAQTLFGVVPGAPRVNNRIKDNPQMYMSGDLPKIEGVTSIRGASTGVVAEEAAKWHAMTGALAMQSQAEIELLKQEVGATGMITTSLSDSYQALLPQMTALTSKAAAASAQIVAELQAGKLTVDQARAQITQLNYEIEAAMGAAATGVAQATGRTINLTQLPLVDQPVVDASGKSNMKEITRPGRTRDLLNRIARGLKVRTYGAGYSTETTMPKRFNSGNLVPGTGNTDTVPAMLTPGEFVVNASATRQNLPLLQAINNGGGNGPGYQFGSAKEIQAEYSGRELAHLTEMLYTKDLNADAHASLMREFGVTYDDVKSSTGRVGSSLTAAYHSFFNQGTNNGNLDIQKAIDYLEGKPVMDPKFGMVTHDPKLAYKAMLMDLGVPESDMSSFGADLDKKIVADLKTSQQGGALYLADTPKGDTQASTAAIGKSVEDHIKSIGNPSMVKALKGLKKPGEFRVQRPGKSSSNRYFPKATSKVSTMLASIVAKKRMPQKLPNLLNIFPKTGKVFSLPKPDIIGEAMATRMPYNRRLYKKNQGGIIGMNSGGMVPGVQYFNEGSDGPVQPAKIRFGSAYASEREKGFVGRGMVGGPMAGMGVGMGMQMAGGMIGGQAGTMMQMASILPMMAPNLLSGIPGMLGKISGGLKGVGGMAGLAGKAIGMAFRVGPLLAITAAIAGAYALFQKFKQEQEQNRIEQTNSIGITEKSAAEAGIKYNNLSESIKAVNDQLDLARAKGKNAYESLNSSGVQGLTLSIKDLKENIKEAKANQKELVSTFSNIDASGDINKQAKVTEVATNLKAQFIAAGMSAQDATNEIYSIISASDKADMAFNAISSKGFRQIIDASTAASAMITKLGKNMNTLSAEDLGNSISNATAALDVNLNKIMKTKDANGDLITQQEAMKQVLDDINSREGSRTTITQFQIEALKKTQPELAKILNTSDNVAGMYSKWRLLLSGVRIDLSKISSEQAQAMAAFEAALDTTITASEKASVGSGIAYKSQQSILSLQKQIAAGGQKASIAAQKTQDQIKEEMKLIDKKIDKINEEADARKKALEATQSKENLALEIQKAQLEYADKMAAGDMAGAAQAQLRIKQLVGERETQKAIDAIEENRAKREKALLAQREKLQAQSDKAANNLTSAQNNAAAATTRMGKIDQYQNEYQRLVKEQSRLDVILNKDPSNKKALEDQQNLVRGPLGDLAKQIAADAKGSDKALATELKKIFGGDLIDKDGNSMAGRVMPSTHPKGIATYKERSADIALKEDAASALSGARAITGGKTLADVYNAILTGQGKGRTLDLNNITSSSQGGRTWSEVYKGNKQINKASIMDTVYNKGRIEKLIKENGLKAGDSFLLNGVKYNVKGSGSIVKDGSYVPPKMSSGGSISGPGTGTSDSIPAYLSNGEFVVNAKSAAAFGYGNLETINKMAAGGLATKFDVPAYSMGGRIKYGDGGAAFGNSNVTINATLNFAEAPKNGRELWKEFKNMARAEGAKIGENIVMGGSY